MVMAKTRCIGNRLELRKGLKFPTDGLESLRFRVGNSSSYVLIRVGVGL